jgi:hypothetical protein
MPVWQHDGFGEWNFLHSNWPTAVIDWDGGDVRLDLCGLLYFVNH